MSRSSPASCVAAVTVYRPDATVLLRMLDRLAAARLRTLVFVDGPTGEAVDAQLFETLKARPGLAVMQAPRNAGIGAALNRLAERARAEGHRRILFLDQDSEVSDTILDGLQRTFDALEAGGLAVAALGPQPAVPAGEAGKPPRYRPLGRAPDLPPNCAAVGFLITSGCLVPLDAWEAVGPFREDFFIDAIDVEWCFRAGASGWTVVLDRSLALPHRIGAGILRAGPLRFPQQSERRMLTYLRNQFFLLRLGHVPLRWKLRTLAYVPAQGIAFLLRCDNRAAFAKAFIRALADGLRGRLGPPSAAQPGD